MGECLGVISRLVSLDFDQRSAQETVAMPRVNAWKSDFSKSLGPTERHQGSRGQQTARIKNFLRPQQTNKEYLRVSYTGREACGEYKVETRPARNKRRCPLQPAESFLARARALRMARGATRWTSDSVRARRPSPLHPAGPCSATRYAAASAAAYVGQDRRLHVWARVPLYASARVAAYLGQDTRRHRMTRISPAPSSIDARQRVRAAILPRGRRGYTVPRVARVSPGCRARQRVWPRTLAKIRAHGRGWVKTGHFAGFAPAGPKRRTKQNKEDVRILVSLAPSRKRKKTA